MTCTRHRVPNCGHSECRRERERRNEATTSDLTDPASPLYQATYGAADYTSTSSSDGCGSSPSSSSYDSGSSSSDSGSSSYDSSGSSSDCGSGY